MDPKHWVPLAEIARAHGVKGEVRLRLFNKASDTLLSLDEVLVRLASGEEFEVSVDGARRADDAILMKLYSVDDRDRAEELRGSLVCARREDFPEAEEGEFYEVDLVGASVSLEGARVGTVKEIISYPTVQTLLVAADDGEGDWEVPLSVAYVASVDVPGRAVTLVTLDDVERIVPKKPKPRPERKPRKGRNAEKTPKSADPAKPDEG